MMKTIVFVMGLFLLGSGVSAAGFDHTHSMFSNLLENHVIWISEGHDSAVNYTGLKKEKDKLISYLESLSSVSKKEYDTWSENQQLSFLINAYNGFTLILIVDHYGKIDSIRDIGGVFSNPWKKKFIPLLGSNVSLDMIEHDFIREEGVFDQPLIHVALVCAAKSCPPLRNKAYVAEKLDDQLSDNMDRFLKDTRKNRFNEKENEVELSSIFKWYKEDFTKGFKGYDSLESMVQKHSDSIYTKEGKPVSIRPGTYKIKFLDYNWALNDVP